MPLLGKESNVPHVDARLLQQFILDNITPKKCYIAANGIQDHKEFVELCKERLGDIYEVPEHLYKRQKSEYIGGEFRRFEETPTISIQLAYESCSWVDPEIYAYIVMRSILGNAMAFSSGGPGKGMYCRTVTHMMQQYGFVMSASVISSHFMDSGLFGIKAVGPGSHSVDLLSAILE